MHTDAQVGLVLGAGGTVGCAYLAGALYAIAHHTGWQPSRATRILGTSAGSLVGALAASGVEADDLVAMTRGLTTRIELPKALTDRVAEPGLQPSWLQMMWAFRPPSIPALVRSTMGRTPTPALLSMVRGQRMDLAPMLRGLDQLNDGGWPSTDFAACTVVATTGRRHVVDRTNGVPLSTAVAASCAVPGLFAAQRTPFGPLVDGGVHSVTNVDALDLDGIEEVWVIAPMAGHVFDNVLLAPAKRRILRRLRVELERTAETVPVRLFSPGPEAAAAMGVDLMAADRADRTVLAGFLEAGDALLGTTATHRAS